MNDVAIVIPAYKIDFFRDTLDSLDKQTCKNLLYMWVTIVARTILPVL